MYVIFIHLTTKRPCRFIDTVDEAQTTATVKVLDTYHTPHVTVLWQPELGN